MPINLMDRAVQGFEDLNLDGACPYLATSDSAAAWHIGRDMAQKEMGRPTIVTASRGYSYNVIVAGRRMKAFIDWSKNPVQIRWENAA